ncbi:MAG: hypothetical protein WCA64_03715 [Gallionella sp.]
MFYRFTFANSVAGVSLAIFSGMAYADSPAGNIELPTAASFYARHFQSLDLSTSDSKPGYKTGYLLAANDSSAARVQPGIAPEPAGKFEPPLLTGRKAHEYLGLGTVLFAGLTALAAPGEACEHNCPPASQLPPRETSGTTHTRLARTTAVLAVATVVTGLLYHWNDFHLEDGLSDPDNQHVMLAGTGALLMLYAINKSANSSVPTSHAGIAELGAASMLVAIKLTW